VRSLAYSPGVGLSTEPYKPLRAFDVRVNESAGSLLLVRGTDAYELRDVESFVWQRCDGARTAEDIAADVVGEFTVDHQDALKDVGSFIEELRNAGLLE
jgi:Coenzyme PQQ synthesis protein D (PqqD)